MSYPITIFRLILLFAFLGTGAAYAQSAADKADSLHNFLNTHRDNASIYVTQNDTVVVRLNENKLMPLAGSVMILIAIEFAQQSAHSVINENGYVRLPDIEKFYIPDTDGGAYPAWVEYAKANKEINDGVVKLVDVARGMMMFSCNANADYLMDLLGFDNVKDNISLLQLKQHTAIFPLAGSLFIYQIPKKSSEEKLMKSLSKYSDKKYSMESYYNHVDLKEDSTFKETFNKEKFSPALQKMWSDNFPSSTTKEYVSVVSALNTRSVLDEEAFFPIGEVMEYPMEKKEFQQKYKHYGAKGGSSAFVFTHVVYFELQNGTRMESAIFFNNLSAQQVKNLENWIGAFEEQVFFNLEFRNKLKFN